MGLEAILTSWSVSLDRYENHNRQHNREEEENDKRKSPNLLAGPHASIHMAEQQEEINAEVSRHRNFPIHKEPLTNVTLVLGKALPPPPKKKRQNAPRGSWRSRKASQVAARAWDCSRSTHQPVTRRSRTTSRRGWASGRAPVGGKDRRRDNERENCHFSRERRRAWRDATSATWRRRYGRPAGEDKKPPRATTSSHRRRQLSSSHTT